MSVLAMLLGSAMVVIALADLMNTLVTTSTSDWKWWPSRIVGYRAFGVVRFVTWRTADKARHTLWN